MNKAKASLVAVVLLVLAAMAVTLDWGMENSRTQALWREAVEPGSLSRSHAFLANNCAACHAPVKGNEPSLCIACHADNTALLQRQPTAFHANIQSCTGCHVEHQGTTRMPTRMDHSLLAQLGHRQLQGTRLGGSPSRTDIEVAAKALPGAPRAGGTEAASPAAPYEEYRASNAAGLPANHPQVAAESMLSCVSCHGTKDRHQGLMGTECIQCHATTQWTVAQFRHPSPRSTECVQCHKAPPSHNMMHFEMVSAPLARRPDAKVNQCFLCHQTTHWNDIKGVGRIKHH